MLCTGERISHLRLSGDAATCELYFRDYELCVSTFFVQQAPFVCKPSLSFRYLNDLLSPHLAAVASSDVVSVHRRSLNLTLGYQ